MKVALLLSGLPRKVQEGYDSYWKDVLQRYDTDVYLHCWKDEQWDRVLEIYNPKAYLCQEPFKFTKYREGVESPNDDMSRPLTQYDVAGNFRGFPMFYSWQTLYGLVEGEYDCVIRSRYDLSGTSPILENLDLTKINISNHHWTNNPMTDDNLCITNKHNADILFKDVFDEFISHVKSTGVTHFQEKNFMEILIRKNLYQLVEKRNDLPFMLLRDNPLWY